MEFSKKILLFSYIMAVTLTLLLIVGSLLGMYVDALANIVLASYAELSVANAFYYNKAKAENQIKIAKALTEEEVDKVSRLTGLF